MKQVSAAVAAAGKESQIMQVITLSIKNAP
jgi:hypothetical protein